jgi:hypothetical protein
MYTDLFSYHEKRGATRYPLAFSVEFDDGSGRTIDVSSCGACIETGQFIASGVPICFTLQQSDYQDDSARLFCSGLVVRSEQHGMLWRVAVCMEDIRFDG